MKLKYALYTLYILLIVYLVFLNGGHYGRNFQLFAFDHSINWIPFSSKMPYFERAEWLHQNDWFYFLREVIGNTLLLFPLPYILYFGERKTASGYILLFCLLTSVGIEALQYLTGLGEADIDDVIFNVGGAIISLITVHLTQLIFKTRLYSYQKNRPETTH